jgi:hypothetical protein
MSTDILRNHTPKREGGGRSRKSAGSKKLTKSSVRNGTFEMWHIHRSGKKTITAFDERVLMTPMSARVLKLEGCVQHVGITTIYCGPRVFSIIDFINLVCKSESENYARRLWPHLKNLFEIQALLVVVPLRIKSPPPSAKTRLGPATDLMGLQRLLLVLGYKVKDEFRQVDDNAFTRFMSGDRSRFIEVDFSSTVQRK